MLINCGIYIMYFECDDGQYYIGKSGNMKERYYDHCRKLMYGSHVNKKMQKAYYLYGCPIMEPIEEVLDLSKQSEREIFWINKLDTYNNGLNGTIGGDDLGFGADSPSSKYTKEQYIEVLKQLATTDKPLSIISQELGISYSVLQKISNGTEHVWLQQEYPEYYAIVKEKCGSRKGLVYTKDKYISAMLMGTDKNNTLECISKTLSLNLSVVKNILYGINHKYLANSHPIEYANMLANKGERLKGTSINKEYPDVISPNGIVYSVTNARKFAKEHSISSSSFHRLLRYKCNSCNGWRLSIPTIGP